MKKTVLVILGAAGLSTPGVAFAGETYIGVSAGVSLPADSQNDGEFTSEVPATPDFGAIPNGTSLGWETDFDTGFSVNGQVGYALDNGLRVELEGAYSKYDVDTHVGLTAGGANIDGADVAVLTRGTPDPANPTVGEVIADGQGQVSNFGIFANVAYDLDTGSGFKPYVGAGIGYQWTDVEFVPSGVPVTDDSDSAFAYQAFAGASFEILQRAEVFGQATYRASFSDADTDLSLLPATLGIETEQTTLTVGLRFRL